MSNDKKKVFIRRKRREEESLIIEEIDSIEEFNKLGKEKRNEQ